MEGKHDLTDMFEEKASLPRPNQVTILDDIGLCSASSKPCLTNAFQQLHISGKQKYCTICAEMLIAGHKVLVDRGYVKRTWQSQTDPVEPHSNNVLFRELP